MNAGIAPPQPGAFSGGGGGGGGSGGDGFGGGGGNSGHHGRLGGGCHNGAPARFGMFPTSRSLTANAVIQPIVNHAESECRKQRINSRYQREEKMDVDAAAQKTATPGANKVLEVYSNYKNEYTGNGAESLFEGNL